uniref:Poly [ADP-ribose] polymerase n=1 Tax=Hanusia phi TaxID=3032 RepID=A0A6T7TA30_9CRYP
MEQALMCEEEVFTDPSLIERFPSARINSLLPQVLSWIRIMLYRLENVINVDAVKADLEELQGLQDPEPLLETRGELMERLDKLSDRYLTLAFNLSRTQIKDSPRGTIEKQMAFVRSNKNTTARELEKLEEKLWKLVQHYPEYLYQVKEVFDVECGGHDRLDMFEVIGRLSQAGQQGARHNVLHVKQEQDEFVIKVFSLSDNHRSRMHFLREARILRRLKHPYIMSLCSAFTEETSEHGLWEVRGYLKMPLLAGGSLRQWIPRVKPDDLHKQRVLMQVLQGLEHLRQNRIIHGDIKPDNILMTSLDEHAEPKIADFDVSKEQEDRARDLVATVTVTSVMGTLQYLAPELLDPTKGGANAGKASHKSDMYAYGIVMLEVLTGTAQRVQSDTKTMLLAGVGADAQSLISKLLEEDPQQRPASAEALTHAYFTSSAIRNMAARERLQQERQEQLDSEHAELVKKQEMMTKLATSICVVGESLRVHERILLEEQKKLLEEGKRLRSQDRKSKSEVQAMKRTVEEMKRKATSQHRELKEMQVALQQREAEHEQERQSLMSEKLLIANNRSVLDPPLYWQHVNAQSPSHTRVKVDVTPRWKEKMQELLTSTCKEGFLGEGRNNRGCAHKGFQVVRVWRVEDKDLWSSYALQRKSIGHAIVEEGEQHPTTSVSTWRDWMGEDLLVDQLSNEAFLLHGTKHDMPDVIIASGYGLDERVFSLQGHFGGGIYLAENSSKSDEYCTPDANGLCYMFLVRAALGSPYEATRSMKQLRRPPARAGTRLYDSVLAVTKETHPDAFLERHREFVVYDRRQAYPEFLIELRRV